MPGQTHRALRIILAVFSAIAAIVGLFLIFSTRGLIASIHLHLHLPQSEVTTMLLAVLKEFGGLILMLSFMLFRVSRDPVRHAAIVDAFILGLVVMTFTPLLSLYTLDIRQLYPGYLIWGRALGRLAVAVLLFFLRPREPAHS